MWKLLIALPATVSGSDIYESFIIFGEIANMTPRKLPMMTHLNQICMADFESFIAEDFNKLQFLEILFTTITKKGLGLYERVHLTNKLKCSKFQCYVLRHHFQLKFSQHQSFERDMFIEFDIDVVCINNLF